MVEVKYRARLGNNLFQYCFGRIIAEGLGYKLKANPIPGFPNTEKQINGKDYSQGYPIQVIAHDYSHLYRGDYSKILSWKNKNLNLKSIIDDKSKRKIVLNGYFQRYEYYKPYKNVIKNNWLLMDMNTKDRIESDDVVVCIRRGDYVKAGIALPFSYYKEALTTIHHRRVFICTDSPHDPFIYLYKRKYNATVHFADTLDKFKFISSFNTIIISHSTYYWWASFLSNATKICAPIPLAGYWSSPEIDLRIDDEKRYVVIQCKEIYKESKIEKLIGLKGKIGSKIKREVKRIIKIYPAGTTGK